MGEVSCQVSPNVQDVSCPVHGGVGRRLDTRTLKAQLRGSLAMLRDVEYRFCPDDACPVVYYSVDGLQIFTESDLRERVFQKHPEELEVFVCYCFRYTVGEVLHSGTAVVEAITQGVKAGQCACDIRNPQGSCCLGNVRSILQKS